MRLVFRDSFGGQNWFKAFFPPSEMSNSRYSALAVKPRLCSKNTLTRSNAKVRVAAREFGNAAIGIMMFLAISLMSGNLVAAQGTSVVVSWDPSPSPALAGYRICWGTNSGAYFATNTYASGLTNAAPTNFIPGNVYYLAVKAFDTNNLESSFSEEIVFTNTLSGDSQNPPSPPGSTNAAPLPPVSGTGTNNGSVSGGATNRVCLPGVPPQLAVSYSNNTVSLSLVGTLGSDILIEHTTSQKMDSWTTVTNLVLTNGLPMPDGSQQSISALLTNAFAPALQQFALPASGQGFELYRASIPYGYAVLANATLSSKGYQTRLIAVRLPGIDSRDVCYVASEGGFIDYDSQTATLTLQPAGPTIREIAAALAGSLQMDWTSASEYVITNNLRQVLATVVKTDPASSDPSAGQAASPIKINF